MVLGCQIFPSVKVAWIWNANLLDDVKNRTDLNEYLVIITIKVFVMSKENNWLYLVCIFSGTQALVIERCWSGLYQGTESWMLLHEKTCGDVMFIFRMSNPVNHLKQLQNLEQLWIRGTSLISQTCYI